MARTVEISLPGELTDDLVEELQEVDDIVGLGLQRGSSLRPPGDVLTIHATNEGLERIHALLARHRVADQGTVLTSEPRSLLAADQGAIDRETNEAIWPEMAALLRRETNLTANYLLAMFLAGVVAGAGLWTDTVHLVVGAMILAPGFEPILRVPFGLLAGKGRAWGQGATATAAGYAAMVAGGALAVLLLTRIEPSDEALGARHWIGYWSTIKPSSVLIALAASAAGAAIVAAQRSVLSAGVMIALALVPSASIVGMALAAGEPALAGRGAARWATDAACVLLGGGLVLLGKRVAARPGEKAAAVPQRP